MQMQTDDAAPVGFTSQPPITQAPKILVHVMQSIDDSQMSSIDYKARAPRATRPRRPAKVEVRAAPPSDSVTSCASSESESPVAEGEPRVVEEVMLAVLLLEWPVAEETAAVPVVEETMLLESVLVMLMEESDSVSLAVLELSVMEEAADDATEEEEELALGAALFVLSITKGGV